MVMSISLKPRELDPKNPHGSKLYPFELVFEGNFLCKDLTEAHKLKDKLLNMRD